MQQNCIFFFAFNILYLNAIEILNENKIFYFYSNIFFVYQVFKIKQKANYSKEILLKLKYRKENGVLFLSAFLLLGIMVEKKNVFNMWPGFIMAID